VFLLEITIPDGSLKLERVVKRTKTPEPNLVRARRSHPYWHLPLEAVQV
jgi:hypothetical protein